MSKRQANGGVSDTAACLTLLQEQSDVQAYRCSQCGKCTAGCPMARSMDITPRRVMRHLQLGLLQPLLHSQAPWLCMGCHTCFSRCPREIPLGSLMEALRRMAASRGIYPLRRAQVFSRAFLAPVRMFGRSHEVSMTALYNLGSGRLTQHFGYLPGMLKGHKLRFIPQRMRDKQALRRMFKEGRP